MNVTERVRTDLARTLARNFPAWDRRERVARAAGLPDAQLAGDAEGSWRCIVDQAIDEGRLPQLLAAATREKPDATDLRDLAARAETGQLVAVPKGPSQLPVLAIGLVTLVLGVAVVGLGARALLSGPEAAPPTASIAPAPPPPPPKAAPKPKPPKKAPEPAPEAAAEPEGPTIVVTPVAPEGEGSAEPVAASPPAPSTAGGAVVKLSSGPCAGAAVDGGRIGYAYAGTEPPTVRDGAWRAPTSVNVRADYPDEHNGFDARATVVCAAPKGGLVELAGEPLAVPGGAYWVPVADVRGP